MGHLEGSALDPLRTSSNWAKKIKTEGWKIVPTGTQLPQGTKISLLEIAPDCINRTRQRQSGQCPSEYRILSMLWKDWLHDMGVSKQAISINKTSNNLNGVMSNLDELFAN